MVAAPGKYRGSSAAHAHRPARSPGTLVAQLFAEAYRAFFKTWTDDVS
jgi:hypothetical protein